MFSNKEVNKFNDNKEDLQFCWSLYAKAPGRKLETIYKYHKFSQEVYDLILQSH